MKKISVVVPVYNRELTIERCINSILKQTIPVEEVVIVDDGSSDNTLNIIKAINCNKIKVIEQNHRGAQAARNLGILNSTGDYIAFLDSDDEWLPNCIETYYKYMNDDFDKVLYADCYILNETNRQKRRWRLPDANGNVYKQLLINPFPMFQGLLVSKKSLLQIGLLDENVVAFQEWDTSISLSMNNEFVHIKEPLFIYHLHEGTTISKDNQKAVKGYEYIINKFKRQIVKYVGYEKMGQHYNYLWHQYIVMKKGYGVFYGIKYFMKECRCKMEDIINIYKNDMRIKNKER